MDKVTQSKVTKPSTNEKTARPGEVKKEHKEETGGLRKVNRRAFFGSLMGLGAVISACCGKMIPVVYGQTRPAKVNGSADERFHFIEHGWARRSDGSVITSVYVAVKNLSFGGGQDAAIVTLSNNNTGREGFVQEIFSRDDLPKMLRHYRGFEYDNVYAGNFTWGRPDLNPAVVHGGSIVALETKLRQIKHSLMMHGEAHLYLIRNDLGEVVDFSVLMEPVYRLMTCGGRKPIPAFHQLIGSMPGRNFTADEILHISADPGFYHEDDAELAAQLRVPGKSVADVAHEVLESIWKPRA